MTRLEKFRELKTHAWYFKSFDKLSQADFEFCLTWIKDKADLGPDEFEYAVNRMFMDRADKPKNWALIMELISSANIRIGEIK